MNPEDISKKAEKERKKIEKLSKPEPVSYKKEEKVYEAFSFKAYSKIYPGRMNFALWFLLCVPATVFFMLHFFDNEMGFWTLYAGVCIVGIFLIRWLIDFIMKLSTYSTYKNFPSKLGFPLEGWERIGTYPNQLNSRYWSKNTTVEVFVKDNINEEQTRLIRDALFLFTTAAGGKFYEAEIGGDGRTEWKQINKLKVMGSSNTAVIGCMYTLLTEYLQSIQAKHHIITLVKINFDPDIFEVSPPAND